MYLFLIVDTAEVSQVVIRSKSTSKSILSTALLDRKMKLEYNFLLFGCLVTGQCVSEIVELTKRLDDLTKKLELTEANNITTTNNRQKKEIIFRGEPEIGDVYVSSILTSDQNEDFETINMFDKNVITRFHSKYKGGDYIRVAFHDTETLKEIKIFRTYDTWMLANPVHYGLQFMLYNDNKLVSLKKATNGAGSPFVAGLWKEFWIPI